MDWKFGVLVPIFSQLDSSQAGEEDIISLSRPQFPLL